MELTLSHEDGYILARTEGPVDESADEVLAEFLHPLVAQRGTKVVVDLSQSPRINSRGLAMLVKLVCDANTHSSRVIFAAATPFVSSVIQVTRLNQFLELVGSLPEAVARVSAA